MRISKEVITQHEINAVKLKCHKLQKLIKYIEEDLIVIKAIVEENRQEKEQMTVYQAQIDILT